MYNHKISCCTITNSHHAQSQTLMIHNHKIPSCTITNSYDAQSQTLTCTITNTRHSQLRPESLIQRKLFKRFVPSQSPSWSWQWGYYTFMQAKYFGLERVLEGDSPSLQPPELEIDDLWEGQRGHKGEFPFVMTITLFTVSLFDKYERLTIWRLVANTRIAGPITNTFASPPFPLTFIYVYNMFTTTESHYFTLLHLPLGPYNGSHCILFKSRS